MRRTATVAKPCTLRYPLLQVSLEASRKTGNPVIAAPRAAVLLKEAKA